MQCLYYSIVSGIYKLNSHHYGGEGGGYQDWFLLLVMFGLDGRMSGFSRDSIVALLLVRVICRQH
jgi:hypothetical protein